MKLHKSIVGDINCSIQTILVESVKLGYVIHDLELRVNINISKAFRHLFPAEFRLVVGGRVAAEIKTRSALP